MNTTPPSRAQIFLVTIILFAIVFGIATVAEMVLKSYN